MEPPIRKHAVSSRTSGSVRGRRENQWTRLPFAWFAQLWQPYFWASSSFAGVSTPNSGRVTMFARCGIQAGPPPSGPATSRLAVFNETRGIAVARWVSKAFTSESRRKGLLGRESLPPGEGLWIRPCEGIHTLGMRFAIDLIYLDRHCRIRKLVQNVRPWRISLCLSAHSVLELPAGAVAARKCQVGDLLSFSSHSDE